MAVESMSNTIESSTHGKQKLFLTDGCQHRASFFSPGTFSVFDHDPPNLFSPLSLRDFQQGLTEIGSISALENPQICGKEEVLSPDSALASTEIANIERGRDRSYPATQRQTIELDNASACHGLSSDCGLLELIEFSDIWGDIRLNSPDMATAALPPSTTLGSRQCSLLKTEPEDRMATPISSEFDKPSGQNRYGCPIPGHSKILMAVEASDIEICQLLLSEQSSHSTLPADTSVTPVGLTSIYSDHIVPLTSTSATDHLLSSKCQLHVPHTIHPTSFQPLTTGKNRFHSQSWTRKVAQAAVPVEKYDDTLGASKVSGTRLQAPCMSISPDLEKTRQLSDCILSDEAPQIGTVTPEALLKLSSLKMKYKSEETPAKPTSRSYQKRPAVVDIDQLSQERYKVDEAIPLDHVQRERQRRDVMTSKIAALELLLPRSSKRDRVTVVYDAIQLLQGLEQEVKVLQEKYLRAKQRRPCSTPLLKHIQSKNHVNMDAVRRSAGFNIGTTGSPFSKTVVNHRLQTHMKPIHISTQFARDNGKMPLTKCVGGVDILNKMDVCVEFHIQVRDDTFTEQAVEILKCRCRMNYLNSAIRIMNQSQLDIVSCSIMKLSGYVLCIMGMKSRLREGAITAAKFVGRLKSVVDVDNSCCEQLASCSSETTSPQVCHSQI